MNKIEEKKLHEEELDKNELMEWGKAFWGRFKSGNLLSQKFVLLMVAVAAAIGLWMYVTRGAKSGETVAWQELGTRTSPESFDEFSKAAPDSTPAKVARLQKARMQLATLGLPQLSAISPDTRGKAIKSIEEARDGFNKLIDEFRNDLTLQAQAIEGAAQTELALVGIPKEGQPATSTDFRGSVDKSIELFERYVKLVGEDNPAGAAAKKKAKDLSDHKDEVVKVQALLNTKMTPTAGTEPKAPTTIGPAGATPSLPPSLTPNGAGPNLPAPVLPEAPKK